MRRTSWTTLELLILDRVPLDEMACRVTAVMMRVRPGLSVKGGRRQIVVEEIRHHLVGEQLHSAVRVMDHEPLAGAEQLVRDDEGPDGVVGGATAGIADDMRVTLGEPGVFGGIQPRVHAGENRKLPSRWQREFALRSELSRIFLIGPDDLIDDL